MIVFKHVIVDNKRPCLPHSLITSHIFHKIILQKRQRASLKRLNSPRRKVRACQQMIRNVSPRVILNKEVLKSCHSCLIPYHMHDSNRRWTSIIHCYEVVLVLEFLVPRTGVARPVGTHPRCDRSAVLIQDVMLHRVVHKREILGSQKPYEI